MMSNNIDHLLSYTIANLPKPIDVMESMDCMNWTTSAPISFFRYVVDKGLNFVLVLGIHPYLVSQNESRKRVKQFILLLL